VYIGGASGRFSNVRPVAVVIDPSDNVYVADDSRGGILEFGPTGQLRAALQLYSQDGRSLPQYPTADDALPAAPGMKSVGTVGGFQLAVSNYSRVAQAASEFVPYRTGRELQIFRAVVASQVPTIPLVAARPEVQQAEPFLATLQDVTRAMRPSAVFGAKYNQASTVIYRGVNQILNGQDAGPILIAVQSQLEQLLA